MPCVVPKVSNSNSDKSKSYASIPIHTKKSWEHDDTLPEWAMENPSDYGGSFDAAGEFHDSEDDDQLHLAEKKEDLHKTNQGYSANNENTDSRSNCSEKTNLGLEHNSIDDYKVEKVSEKSSTGCSKKKHVENVQKDCNRHLFDERKNKSCSLLKHQHNSVDRMQEVADDMVAQLMMEDEFGMLDTETDVKLPPQLHATVTKDSNRIPDNCSIREYWYYQDPQNKIQGPFCATEMAEWYNAGYFDETLLVKRNCDVHFSSLGDLIKSCSGSIPFLASHLIPPIQVLPEGNQASILSMISNVASPTSTILETDINLKYQLSLLQKQYFMRQHQLILQKLSSTEPWSMLTSEQQEAVLCQHLSQITLPDSLMSITDLPSLSQNQLQELQHQTLQFSLFGVQPKITSFYQSQNPLNVPSNIAAQQPHIGSQMPVHEQLNLLNDGNLPQNPSLSSQLMQSMNLHNFTLQNVLSSEQRRMLAHKNKQTETSDNPSDPIKSLILQLSSSKESSNYSFPIQHPQILSDKSTVKDSSADTILTGQIWNVHSSSKTENFDAATQSKGSLAESPNVQGYQIDLNMMTNEKESLMLQEVSKSWKTTNHSGSSIQEVWNNTSNENNSIEKSLVFKNQSDSNDSGLKFYKTENENSTRPFVQSQKKININNKKETTEMLNIKYNKNKKDAEVKPKTSTSRKDSDEKKKDMEEKKRIKEQKKRLIEEEKKRKDEEEKRKREKKCSAENKRLENIQDLNKKCKNFEVMKRDTRKIQESLSQLTKSAQNKTEQRSQFAACVAPWSNADVHTGPSLAEIEKLEIKTRAEQIKAELAVKDENLPQKKNSLKWNAKNVFPQAIKSLAEIQAEEHAKQSAAEKEGMEKLSVKNREDKDRTLSFMSSFWNPSVQRSAWNTGKVWSSNSNLGVTSSGGFWEDPSKNYTKSLQTGTTLVKSQTVGNISTNKAQTTEKQAHLSKQNSALVVNLTSASMNNSHKLKKGEIKDTQSKDDSLAVEFNNWCTKALTAMQTCVDGELKICL